MYRKLARKYPLTRGSVSTKRRRLQPFLCSIQQESKPWGPLKIQQRPTWVLLTAYPVAPTAKATVELRGSRVGCACLYGLGAAHASAPLFFCGLTRFRAVCTFLHRSGMGGHATLRGKHGLGIFSSARYRIIRAKASYTVGENGDTPYHHHNIPPTAPLVQSRSNHGVEGHSKRVHWRR